MISRSDGIYWRWSYRAPVQFIPLEDCWFYPGEGPCVDGFYYWQVGKYVKRLDLETWKLWGRKKSPPPDEHTDHEGIRLEFFLSEKGLEAEPKAYYTGMDKRSKS